MPMLHLSYECEDIFIPFPKVPRRVGALSAGCLPMGEKPDADADDHWWPVQSCQLMTIGALLTGLVNFFPSCEDSLSQCSVRRIESFCFPAAVSEICHQVAGTVLSLSLSL